MMNKHEQIACEIAKDQAMQVVGGRENTLLDYLPEDEEYQAAAEELKDHDLLAWMTYERVMNLADRGAIQHLRFAGSNFIEEQIETILTGMGY